MLEKHELKTLSDAASENINFAKVMELDVRPWVVMVRLQTSTHTDRDELFCCLEGIAHLDRRHAAWSD